MNSKIAERNSNFEFLRIIAMFMIVLLHSVYFGVQFKFHGGGGTFNEFFSIFIGAFCGGVGNYLFVFISAWFLCEEPVSLKRVLKIWKQVLFYSIIIGVFFFIKKIPTIGFYDRDLYDSVGFFNAAKPIGKIDLIRSFLPVLMGNNWFATCYIVFYLFVPILNNLTSVLERKRHFYLIALMAILGTVVSFVPGQGMLHPSNLYYFITAYFIAGYIKKYDPPIFNSSARNIVIGFLICVFCGLWNCALNYFSESYKAVDFFKEWLLLGNINKFPILLTSVFIFCGFVKMKPFSNRIINLIASTTFGVYLIHVNGLLKIFIWHKILLCDSFADSPAYPLYLLASSLIVFIACSLIDLFIRQPLTVFVGYIRNCLSRRFCHAE